MKKSAFALHLCSLVLFVFPPLFAAPPLSISAIRQREGEEPGEAIRKSRLALIAEAEKYRGAPYRYGGIDSKGFDCSGLVYRSFQDALSVSVPRSTTALYNWVERIDAGALQPGDLVFFSTLPSDKRRISHAGIYAGEGRFIHAASDGPLTGVIYSRLDEDYWRRTFAAAGRALPAAPPEGRRPELASLSVPETPRPAASPEKLPQVSGDGSPLAGGPAARLPETGGTREAAGEGGSWRDKLLLGVGFAPTWNGVLSGGNIIRGGASQLGLAWKGKLLGRSFMPGVELRPEWDNTLGVFRMPLTFSLGLDERFRIFAGPAFSIGDAELGTKEGRRRYTGGNAVIGAAGLSFAPFPIKAGQGTLSIYGEAAWQSYFPKGGEGRNPNADFSAAFRISTGLRYTWGF
ncbi:MAG: C40 family peptidase [Treponema sp.]|jgi:probable lipoprotein NlpC|nr:C40 family peptidase [Treponema sp.]